MRLCRTDLNLDFWKFWAGQAISTLGSSFTTFALPLLVFKLTGSALNLALATVATFLPYLLFGLVIGAAVDRVDRKRLMILVDVGRAVVIATVPLLAAVDRLSVWWVYLATFVSTTLSIAFEASQFAAVPSLVGSGEGSDDAGQALVRANGRIQASYSAATVVGPLLAGALLAVAPVHVLLMVDAVSFLVSALSLGLIGTSFNPGERKDETSLWQGVVDGLRYVLSDPVLRNISVMMALMNFVGATIAAQLVLFAEEQLGASDREVGLLFAAGSVGVVLCSLAASSLRQRWRFSVVALGALALSGVLTVVLAVVPWFWAAVVLWAGIRGLGILFNINTGSLRQAIVPNHLLGRVMSVAMVLAWSAIPLGALVGGLAVEWTGDVRLVYAVCGVLSIVIPVAFSFTALGRATPYPSRSGSGLG